MLIASTRSGKPELKSAIHSIDNKVLWKIYLNVLREHNSTTMRTRFICNLLCCQYSNIFPVLEWAFLQFQINFFLLSVIDCIFWDIIDIN